MFHHLNMGTNNTSDSNLVKPAAICYDNKFDVLYCRSSDTGVQMCNLIVYVRKKFANLRNNRLISTYIQIL